MMRFNKTQLSFLSIDQALEDVVVFAKTFQLPPNATAVGKLKSSDALHSDKTPWIFVGAGYSGLRAAILRVRNPDV